MANRVIIDTSAIYALVSASDDFHDRAFRTYRRLIDERAELFTTSYTLVETYALIHRRLGFEPVMRFAESVQDIVNVFWIDPSLHSEAWNAMVARNGQGLSFVDWCTVAAAHRLNAQVFAFDADFLAEGLITIP